MNDSIFDINELEKLVVKNIDIREKEEEALKNLETLVDLLSMLFSREYNISDIIANEENLNTFSITILYLIEKENNINPEVKKTMQDLFKSVYEYLYYGSEAQEIEIPKEIYERIKCISYFPERKEIKYLFTLIHINKKYMI